MSDFGDWFDNRGRRPAQGFAAAMLVALLLLACRDETQSRDLAARSREWAQMQAQKRSLDAERAALAAGRARLGRAPVGADGELVDSEAIALAADLAARQRQVSAGSARLEERLVRLLATLSREPPPTRPPTFQQVVRLKSDEDIEVAAEWIERGGDYRRAIEIYETQRALDPGYERLERALARARQMRFVTPDRLARVREGMTRAEVRAILGPVNLRQVLRRPSEQLEAWYYPAASGGRAAVFLRYEAPRRAYVVYAKQPGGGAPAASPPRQGAA